MPINSHASWVYIHIYSQPYPHFYPWTEVPRQTHGIQHVTRTALYIPIFINLYRRYGNEEALALTDEDIKLLQIAALFHDCARESDGVDLWDQDSALFFYEYATNLLQIDPAKAKLLAEAIANKDADSDTYFKLELGPGLLHIWNKHYSWKLRGEKSPKNIYQKIIHDADCLDVIRARDHFDASYLDFYKDIAFSNTEAFNIMAKLITEARSLIDHQGDTLSKINLTIKCSYEHPDSWDYLILFIAQHPHLYPLIFILGTNKLLIGEDLHQQLLPSFSKEASPAVTEESLTHGMYLGTLFSRGVGSPAAVYKDRIKDTQYTAELETYKMTRTPNIRTRSNKLGKKGNPNRSICMLTHGVVPYAGQGYLKLNLIIDDVDHISSKNLASGRGKKNHIVPSGMSRDEKSTKLEALHRTAQMGGSSIRYGGLPYTHNEILYRMADADAIYFTKDPTRHNHIMYGDPYPFNDYTHYLQALFLQIEYERATGITLPIYEYSGTHNLIKAVPKPTEEDIIGMWASIFSTLIKQLLKFDATYWTYGINELKILAIDGYIGENSYIRIQNPLDINYSTQLKGKINKTLEEIKLMYESKYFEKIQDGEKLRDFLTTPRAKLQPEYKKKMWINVQEKLATLIKNGTQLLRLLVLSVELLNTLERTQIITAIESQLGTLIKDGNILWYIFELPLECLNSLQRDQILNAIKDNLGTLIKDEFQLYELLSLSESKLPAHHKKQIIDTIGKRTALDYSRHCEKLAQLINQYSPSDTTSPTFLSNTGGNTFFQATNQAIKGMHRRINNEQTLRLLKDQLIGTYLLRASLSNNKDLVLAFINKDKKIQQIPISPSHSAQGSVICSGTIFSSLRGLINHYTTMQNGGAALLQKELIPLPDAIRGNTICLQVTPHVIPSAARDLLAQAHSLT